MSAEVILMNKNGIAIAADSAVTIGNKTKIYNTADKMFMLSKYAPVGILIYNSSDMMGIQLELIIKQYREKLEDKKYSTIKEYVDDFLEFCISFINKYSGEKIEIELINGQILNNCDEFFKRVASLINKELTKGTLKDDEELMKFANEKSKEFIAKLKVNNNNELIDDEYFNYILDKIDTNKIVKNCSNEYMLRLDEETEQLLTDKLNNLIRDKKYWNSVNYTGIAITGYGESEIFPSCIQIDTLGIINNRMFIINKKTYNVTHDSYSKIVPLAQTDVMNEFFLGVNNEVEQIYNRKFTNRINSEKNEELKNEIVDIKKDIESEKEKLVRGRLLNIHTSLSFLPRDEMIYMAEGMINLTSFKRRLVLDNYSETVGGPIDLAFISKGDGFIWIRRKKYFDKEMNYVFTENYFKKKGE